MTQSKVVFGRWETITFLLNLMGMQIILGFPRMMSETANTAGWIVVLYVSILAFLGFMLISRLYARFEGKDLVEVGEYVAGTPGRIIVGFLFIVELTLILTVTLREFAEDMKTIILPQSPISFIMLFLSLGMVVGAYRGLEAIVRFNSLVVPIIAFGLLFITLTVAPYYDINNLFPLLGEGLPTILTKGFLKISIFSALAILYLIYPHVKTHKNFKIIGYTSLISASIAFLIGTLAYSLTFPIPIAQELFLPVYSMARLISYGRFFQRVESIFVLIWAASALLYLSSIFYLILDVFRKSFKLEYYRPLILPFILIIFTLSLFPPNLVSAIELENRIFRNYAWIVTFVLPIAVLAIAYFKKGKSKGGSKR